MTMHLSLNKVNAKALNATITQLSTQGKGILAADESIPTITKRLESVNVTSTEETRREYRELLLSTPKLNNYVAGVILFEETLNQHATDGTPLPTLLNKLGILPGIKVDKGLIPLINGAANEKITQGLDGLPERLQHYKEKGAVFAKWRAVYSITQTNTTSEHPTFDTPTALSINTNANILARYAATCQAHGIVPIVEPEVLIDGDHSIACCEAVTARVLHALFNQLYHHNVILEYIVLKPSMVISGKTCKNRATPEQVAQATLRVFRQHVPAAVPTINFLSGGQTPIQATENLNAMNCLAGPVPWQLSFSYARALQGPCLHTWQGKKENTALAQQALYERTKLNSAASLGNYSKEMEETVATA